MERAVERAVERVNSWFGNGFSKIAIQTDSLPTLLLFLRDESNEATKQ